MRRSIIKISVITMLLAFCVCLMQEVYAASIGISVGYSTITVGGSTTMTISGNDAIGKVSISSSDPNVVSVSQSSLWLEGSANITLTTKSVGTSTITLSAVDMSDGAGNAFSGSRSITITSKPVYIDTRSTNNYLSGITVGHDLSLNEEFSRDNMEYTLTIPHTIDLLDLSATTEDPSASFSINGTGELKTGENIVTIVVTAENEMARTYTIKVTKEEDPESKITNLKSLKITGATLRNEFDKETYFYLAEDVYADTDDIKVEAVPEVKEAKVEISGNKDLKIGLNVIEIKVTSKDETTSSKYRVEVYKLDEVLKLVDLEEENTLKNFLKHNWMQLVLILVVLAEFIIIIVLISKKNEKHGDLDKHYERKQSYSEETESIQNFEENESEISINDSEITEDTLKYSDPTKNDSTRRHRRK